MRAFSIEASSIQHVKVYHVLQRHQYNKMGALINLVIGYILSFCIAVTWAEVLKTPATDNALPTGNSSLSYLGCYNNTLNKLLAGTFNNSATNSPIE